MQCDHPALGLCAKNMQTLPATAGEWNILPTFYYWPLIIDYRCFHLCNLVQYFPLVVARPKAQNTRLSCRGQWLVHRKILLTDQAVAVIKNRLIKKIYISYQQTSVAKANFLRSPPDNKCILELDNFCSPSL